MIDSIIGAAVDFFIKISDGHPGYIIIGFAFAGVVLTVYWYMKNIHPLKKLSEKIDALATREDVQNVKTEVLGANTKLTEINLKFVVVESRVETLWQDKFAPAHSPRRLNEQGENILTVSGIKEIIDEHKADFVAKITEKNITNAFDCEQAILDLANDIPNIYPEVLDSLKEGAFKTGSSVDAILFVGGIYLRDLIMADCGFSVDDIDRHQPIIPRQTAE